MQHCFESYTMTEFEELLQTQAVEYMKSKQQNKS